MTTFPGSPRLTRGAIVGLDPFNPLASIIAFQYNLETLTRRLEACVTASEGCRSWNPSLDASIFGDDRVSH
jgi:hypothetical protein